MEELLANETARLSLRPLRVGETVEGAIASVGGDEATVDLGDRPAGVIPLREAGPEQLRVGEHVIAVVMQPEDPDGRVVLSLRRARNRKQWTEMEELQKSGDLIDASVLEANRGGVVVGLVHRSEITWDKGIEPTSLHRLGDAVKVRVVGIDRERQRISLSIKR